MGLFRRYGLSSCGMWYTCGMEDNKCILGVVIAICATIILLTGSCAVDSINTKNREPETIKACMDGGGEWVSGGDRAGLIGCIRD